MVPSAGPFSWGPHPGLSHTQSPWGAFPWTQGRAGLAGHSLWRRSAGRLRAPLPGPLMSPDGQGRVPRLPPAPLKLALPCDPSHRRIREARSSPRCPGRHVVPSQGQRPARLSGLQGGETSMEADFRRSLSSSPKHPAGPGTGGGERARGLWCHQAGVARWRGPRRPTPSTDGRQEGQDQPYQGGCRPPHLPLTERWGARP